MKAALELNIMDDDHIWLNFWDAMNGRDVVCKVEKGKLFLDDRRIDFAEFVDLVRERLTEE